MPQAPARKMGTWKLAYADFLTALVAFFIVMWLVKGMPEDGRADLAGYFRNEQASAQQMMGTHEPAARDKARRLAADLQSSPLFTSQPDALSVIAEADKVRIDLVDRTSDPVFEPGAAGFTEAGEALAGELAALISTIPGSIEIEGHTDAFVFRQRPGGNWALSGERAEMARAHMIEAGLSPARIEAVTGRAATAPRYRDEPHLPANRRVTIILHITQ